MDAVAALAYPVFVKPARAGSSMGISKVSSPEALERAIEVARTHDLKVVVEAGHRRPRDRVRRAPGPRHRRAARLATSARSRWPPRAARVLRLRGEVPRRRRRAVLPGRRARRGRRRGAAAGGRGVRGAGCEGLARVDCFYTGAGDVVINEINTMPGFTPHSMYPQMWQATRAGLPRADRRAARARPGPPPRAPLSRSTRPSRSLRSRGGRDLRESHASLGAPRTCQRSRPVRDLSGTVGAAVVAAGAGVRREGLGGGVEGGQERGARA